MCRGLLHQIQAPVRVLPGGGRNLGSPRLPRSTWKHRYWLGVFPATASISMFMVHLASFYRNPNHDKATHFLSVVILKPFRSFNCILRQQLLSFLSAELPPEAETLPNRSFAVEKNHYFLLVFISISSFLYCIFSFYYCKEKSRIAWTQFSLLWTKSHRLSFTVMAWNVHLKTTGTWRKSSYTEARSTNYIWILHHKTLGQLCHWLNPNSFNWKAKPARLWTHQWDWKSWSDEQTWNVIPLFCPNKWESRTLAVTQMLTIL